MRKQLFVFGFIVFLLLGSVSLARAETVVRTFYSEAEFRAYALARIEELLAQIETLQAILESRRQIGAFESFIIKDSADVVARYQTDRAGTVGNSLHKIYWDRFLTLTPDAYDDYFDEFVVFDNARSNIDSFVETLPPYQGGSWRFGLGTTAFDIDLTSPTLDELLVHEFGHVVSYEDIPGLAVPGTLTCHEYFTERFDCPEDSTYLAVFVDRFWNNSALNYALRTSRLRDPSAAVTAYYEDHESSFVSDYAASAPEEDFAETFASFVLQDRPVKNTTADQKIKFFYRYPKLVSLRSEIRQQIE
ncbi:MAG: hypothetical protein AAB388_00135 [Patescibacteria group bacterium]